MKNKRLLVQAPRVLKKPFLIMKLTLILTVFCVFQSFAGEGQTVTLDTRDTEIRKVLTRIEKQGSFRFLFNSRLDVMKQKIDVSLRDADISAALTQIFAGTELTFKRLDNNLIAIRSGLSDEQLATISGRVTSPSGDPLNGVSVSIKGTSTGTTTNVNGEFALSAPDDATLVFSSVGFTTLEEPVNSRTTINVTLQASTRTMDEVVVIGYGTASKRDLTGSIVKVAGREVSDKPNTNPVSSLQGKVAGVSVVNGGLPGQEPDIRIRGTISRFQTKPLYVVDGLFNDNINFLNPSDIESIEILKDPSSLAIFGVRGANGVIMVTTKQGKSGRIQVNASSTIGFKKIQDKVEMTDAEGFKMLFDEQRVNQGTAPFQYYDRFTGNSNWVDLISQENPIITTNNVSISSGSEKNKFYMGVGYIKEEGLIKYEKLDKIILNISDELKASKAIKVGFNINGYRQYQPSDYRDFIAAINATPIVEPFNEAEGVYNKLPNEIGGPQIGNPLLIDVQKNTSPRTEYRVVGSVFAEIAFLKNFTFRTTYYGDMSFVDYRKFTPIINVYSGEDGTVAPYNTSLTQVDQKQQQFRKYQQEYLLTYKKNFGDHSLTALGGFTTYYSAFSETNGQVKQSPTGEPIPNDKRFWYLDNFFGDKSTRISGITEDDFTFGPAIPKPLEWESTTVSMLARLLYNYQGKYMLNASFRRDGSSEISPNNRYQNFVAVGAAWELTKENFMNNQKIFDFLKVKASWGVLGNQYVGIHYPFYPQLVGGQTAVFGRNLIPAFSPAYLADPNLKWETVNSAEGGFEMMVLKNRLRFEANYFNKVTDNLLTVFPGIGGTAPGITNAGKVQNSGIEASAAWNDKIGKDFGYTISGNITTLNNEVKELYKEGFEVIDGASRTFPGHPIGYFYGYEVEGVYQSYADKLKSPVASSLGDYGPGDLKFKDQDGNGIVNDQDRIEIGNPTPDFIYGFSLGANFKGLDFSIDFQGVYGNEIYREWGNGSTFAPFNYRAARLDRWSGPGTSNWEPATTGRSINMQASTYMIEDGSYLRIRNVQLGYNVSTAALSRIKLKTLRIFINAQNPKTFKRNSGFTPEFGGSAIKFGTDNGSYPVPAVYSAGLNFTF